MDWLVPIHVVAGSVALIAGAGALLVRKGGRWHARTGTWFAASMMVMAGLGALIALLRVERGTAVIGLFTCYLIVTAWTAARNRSGRPGSVERAGLVVVIGCLFLFVLMIWAGRLAPDGRFDSLPWSAHIPFAVVAALAAGLDANLLSRGTSSYRERVTRHLWRMSTALLIAASSFFLGQQDEFPQWLRGSPALYAPPLAVLGTMIFWIGRMRWSGRKHAPRIAGEAA